MPIRTVIFDLGRVIVPFDFDRAYARVTARTGLDREAIRERVREAGIVPRFESGQIEPRPFV